MAEQNYDYSGMIVTYWDLLRGDTSKWSSRPYFLQIIRERGEPALDVAWGAAWSSVGALAKRYAPVVGGAAAAGL